MPHQICRFHVIKELTKAVLHAVAKVRKQLEAQKPTLDRGRPSTKQAKRRSPTQEAAGEKDYRPVRAPLPVRPAPPQPRRAEDAASDHPRLASTADAASIMDEVYRLFDRRCRTDTALEKLAPLRRRVRRFKAVGQTLQKLFSAGLEKALTFLDDRLLGSTSNAVERGNRRHRKMQKTVYRVRTQRAHRRANCPGLAPRIAGLEPRRHDQDLASRQSGLIRKARQSRYSLYFPHISGPIFPKAHDGFRGGDRKGMIGHSSHHPG